MAPVMGINLSQFVEFYYVFLFLLYGNSNQKHEKSSFLCFCMYFTDQNGFIKRSNEIEF